MINPVVHELTSPALVELPDYAVLDATGSDAQSFLKGQFCNDLAEATSNRAQLSGYCNPKGRLLALFTVFAIDEGYRLVLHRDLLDPTSKRLQMFVMRADVKIVARNDLLCSGVILPKADSFDIERPDIPALPQVMDVKTNEVGNWVRTGEVQTLFIAGADAQQTLLNAGTDIADVNAWRLQKIQAGIPSLFAATVEQFVPQMINLQQAGGLSFTHGCYPGQEIVARMQYLGKLKRQMLRFTLAGDDAPPAGAPITTADDTEVGVVIDAVATDEGVQLLAVMKIANVDEALMMAGQPLSKQTLPYDEP
ncbi:MAG: hypothetical protein V3U65_04865 [Granulosicoccaceae bacterium]